MVIPMAIFDCLHAGSAVRLCVVVDRGVTLSVCGSSEGSCLVFSFGREFCFVEPVP